MKKTGFILTLSLISLLIWSARPTPLPATYAQDGPTLTEEQQAVLERAIEAFIKLDEAPVYQTTRLEYNSEATYITLGEETVNAVVYDEEWQSDATYIKTEADYNIAGSLGFYRIDDPQGEAVDTIVAAEVWRVDGVVYARGMNVMGDVDDDPTTYPDGWVILEDYTMAQAVFPDIGTNLRNVFDPRGLSETSILNPDVLRASAVDVTYTPKTLVDGREGDIISLTLDAPTVFTLTAEPDEPIPPISLAVFAGQRMVLRIVVDAENTLAPAGDYAFTLEYGFEYDPISLHQLDPERYAEGLQLSGAVSSTVYIGFTFPEGEVEPIVAPDLETAEE